MTEQGWIPAGHLEAPKCRFRFWLWAECGGVRVRARGVGGLAAKGPVKQRTLSLRWAALGVQQAPRNADRRPRMGQEALSGCDSGPRWTNAARKCRGGHGPSTSCSVTSPVSDILQQAGTLAQLLGRGSQKDGGHPWGSVDPPESKPAEATVHPTLVPG